MPNCPVCCRVLVLLLFGRQFRQGAQRSFIPFGIEGAVLFQQCIDLDGKHVGHQLQDLFTLVADQGQLVEGGLGGGWVFALDLVFDGFDQGRLASFP